MIHCRYIILEKLRTLGTLHHSSIKHADREAFFSEKKKTKKNKDSHFHFIIGFLNDFIHHFLNDFIT